MLRHLLSQPIVFMLWLLHFLPLKVLAFLGNQSGEVMYLLARHRRKVVDINLAWCFPELDREERNRLARNHFRVLGRSILERGLLWWASQERLKQMIRIEGMEKIRVLHDAGHPIILLAPHFVGLDVGGAIMTMNFDLLSMYAEQANPVFDRLLLNGRHRFGDLLLLTRKDGIRATIKAMKSGRPFYYLPDLGARRRESIFVPFFGIPTATITGLSRLAQITGAKVLPCVTRILPGAEGYLIEIGDAWENFPTEDVEADTARMNAWFGWPLRSRRSFLLYRPRHPPWGSFPRHRRFQ